jgi:hypothetical protein
VRQPKVLTSRHTPNRPLLKTLLVVVSLSCFPAIASTTATVDMRNANYNDTWKDQFEDPLKPGNTLPFEIQRTYNSRTLFQGLFGFAWCTDFETTLVPMWDGSLVLTDCGAGAETVLHRERPTILSTQSLISRILAAVQRRNPDWSAAKLKETREQLEIDSDLREEFAKQLSLRGETLPGRYVNDTGDITAVVQPRGETIVTSRRGCACSMRKTTAGTVTEEPVASESAIEYMFDRTLKLHRWISGSGTVVDLNRAAGYIDLQTSSGIYRLETTPQGVVATVRHAGRIVGRYEYRSVNHSQELARAISRNGHRVFNYRYDKYFNLIGGNAPDGGSIELTYDTDHDWVTSFHSDDGCTEQYAYVDYPLPETVAKLFHSLGEALSLSSAGDRQLDIEASEVKRTCAAGLTDNWYLFGHGHSGEDRYLALIEELTGSERLTSGFSPAGLLTSEERSPLPVLVRFSAGTDATEVAATPYYSVRFPRPVHDFDDRHSCEVPIRFSGMIITKGYTFELFNGLVSFDRNTRDPCLVSAISWRTPTHAVDLRISYAARETGNGREPYENMSVTVSVDGTALNPSLGAALSMVSRSSAGAKDRSDQNVCSLVAVGFHGGETVDVRAFRLRWESTVCGVEAQTILRAAVVLYSRRWYWTNIRDVTRRLLSMSMTDEPLRAEVSH